MSVEPVGNPLPQPLDLGLDRLLVQQDRLKVVVESHVLRFSVVAFRQPNSRASATQSFFERRRI